MSERVEYQKRLKEALQHIEQPRHVNEDESEEVDADVAARLHGAGVRFDCLLTFESAAAFSGRATTIQSAELQQHLRTQLTKYLGARLGHGQNDAAARHDSRIRYALAGILLYNSATVRAAPTSSNNNKVILLRAAQSFNGAPWQDAVVLRVANPAAGTRRAGGFVEPQTLKCFARIIAIFECCIDCDGGRGEPLALIQWYDGFIAAGRRERIRRQGQDIFRHDTMPTQPCMVLEDKFDVISLDRTVEGCAWVVEDFDVPGRHWQVVAAARWGA